MYATGKMYMFIDNISDFKIIIVQFVYKLIKLDLENIEIL